MADVLNEGSQIEGSGVFDSERRQLMSDTLVVRQIDRVEAVNGEIFKLGP